MSHLFAVAIVSLFVLALASMVVSWASEYFW
jgi:hypothetical protein